MPVTVDARGLACPQPVIHARNAMREADDIIVLVSSQESVANVRRLAERAGWAVTVDEQEGAFALHLLKGAAVAQPEASPAPAPGVASGGAVLLISADRMGRGEDELGAILIRAFFHTLTETDELPATLVLYNTGVKLAVEGSPVVEDLRVLADKGMEILACGTCLKYFELEDHVAVGTISNMYIIAETLLGAGRVISV
ncbi:MAG: sulfurtransferase-like selenium metabolism protein YedF [Anaerolineae bacterium]|nr:sulfurtransferase-like selenium metabolism protein YedF [Anaerolineae bacterium]